jgi:hypothetical protein
MHGSRSKIPSKNLVRQRFAEGCNSGVKGLTSVTVPFHHQLVQRICYYLDGLTNKCATAVVINVGNMALHGGHTNFLRGYRRIKVN